MSSSSEILPLDVHPIEGNIYFSAEENTNCLDDPNLPGPTFTCGIRVIHRISSDNININIPTEEVTIHASYQEFHHNLYEVIGHPKIAECAVFRMLSSVSIPFSIHKKFKQDSNLHWKLHDDLLYDNNNNSSEKLAPLCCCIDVLTWIAGVVLYVAEKTEESGRKLTEMVVTINKHTIVSHEDFERLFPSTLPDTNDNNNVDEDEYEYEYEYKYEYEYDVEGFWAIEESLSNALDRCPKRASRWSRGRKSRRVKEIATMIKERKSFYDLRSF